MKKQIIRSIANMVPDGPYLRVAFKKYLGYPLSLSDPKTYNEKLQWLKLHDRNPLYTTLVDKYAVKKWVAQRIGEEHVVKTIASWDSPDNILLEDLPDRFVLKTNHDSGTVCICRDKSTFDLESAKKKLSKSMARNYYYMAREWPYKNVKPIVFAEEYLETIDHGDVPDYKFFCFDSKCKLMFVATDRFAAEDTKFDFFDENYNWLDVKHGHPNADVQPPKPPHFEMMKDLAEKLSRGIPHVRVDFYDTPKGVFFGEMTFYHHAGFVPFVPSKWDLEFGKLIDLSLVSK